MAQKQKQKIPSSLYDMSKFIPVVSQHLRDCDDLIVMADKFGREEKDELNRKLKEYRKK